MISNRMPAKSHARHTLLDVDSSWHDFQEPGCVCTYSFRGLVEDPSSMEMVEACQTCFAAQCGMQLPDQVSGETGETCYWITGVHDLSFGNEKAVCALRYAMLGPATRKKHAVLLHPCSSSCLAYQATEPLLHGLHLKARGQGDTFVSASTPAPRSCKP